MHTDPQPTRPTAEEVSAAIDRYVLNEWHRQLLRRRLINRVKLARLAEEADRDISTVKRIIYSYRDVLGKTCKPPKGSTLRGSFLFLESFYQAFPIHTQRRADALQRVHLRGLVLPPADLLGHHAECPGKLRLGDALLRSDPGDGAVVRGPGQGAVIAHDSTSHATRSRT